VIVGLTGFYMTQRLELWERFWSSEFWWMHAMVCLWLVFTGPAVCRRTADFAPMVPCAGERDPRYRLYLSASGSLAAACAQPDHDLRGRRW
jgi:hypothetical protein